MLAFAVLYSMLSCIDAVKIIIDCIYPGKVGNQADYYWRDYFGVIPKDAVAGGYNVDGNVTYVTQTSHTVHVGIFPGNIYPGKMEGFTCPGSRFADATYVKILCINPHYTYEWLPVTIDETPLLTDYQWVVGGSQSSTILYIGRANFEGQVQVGRVYPIDSPHKGLWICNKAGSQMNFKSFELLVLAR